MAAVVQIAGSPGGTVGKATSARSSHGEHRDVVLGGRVADHVSHHPLADGRGWTGYHRLSQAVEPFVDDLAAPLDEPVGVHDDDCPSRQRNRGHRARAGEADAEGQAGTDVGDLGRATRTGHHRRRMARQGPPGGGWRESVGADRRGGGERPPTRPAPPPPPAKGRTWGPATARAAAGDDASGAYAASALGTRPMTTANRKAPRVNSIHWS